MAAPKDYQLGFNRSQVLILQRLWKRGVKRTRLARRGSRMQELVDMIRETNPRYLIRPEMCTRHGFSEPTVHAALTRMIVAGELERVSHGLYHLTRDVRTPA